MNPVSPFNIGTLSVSRISINSVILWVIFGLFFLLYAIISAVLIYHWRAYGMSSRAIILAETVFIIVSLVLFSLAVISIGIF